MSDKNNTPKQDPTTKKDRKNKRPATSPLLADILDTTKNTCNDSDHSNVYSGERKSGQSTKKYKQQSGHVSEYTDLSNLSGYYQAMSFPQPPFAMTPYMTSPTQPQFSGGAFSMSTPPPWASELLEDMKQIKQKLQTVDKIEKTVNLINAKISDMETKIKKLDTRVSDTEKTCEFIANENETRGIELKRAKDDIKLVKKSCERLENASQELKSQKAELDAKVIDLETKSMRDNLMFYGINEGGEGEDCVKLVKRVLTDHLKIDEEETNNILIDRAHRLGRKSRSKAPRPIVAKFHYPNERERVRQKSFELSEYLKATKLGIGVQLPRELREARKPLINPMKEAKEAGKTVRFVGARLFIDGEEYIPDSGTGH